MDLLIFIRLVNSIVTHVSKLRTQPPQENRKAAKEPQPAEGAKGEHKNRKVKIYTEARSYVVV